MNVHKDPESKVDYSGKSTLKDRIGIKLPADLATKTKHPEIYPKNYGCYNFIHRIDGKIVAVAIVDILPTFLSTKTKIRFIPKFFNKKIYLIEL